MDYKTNSPHQHLRDCIENSMENMHTDVDENDGELAELFASKYLKLTGFLIGFEVATKPSKWAANGSLIFTLKL